MAELYGVDVSEFQGTIDWDALNAVCNFVMIRASFGTMRQDYQFARNQSEARRVQRDAGPLGIGYYYYAYPTLVDAVTSANFFVDNLGLGMAGDVLALDLEGDIGNDPVGWSLAWLRQVEARTTVKPLVYLNQSIMNGYSWQPVVDNGNGLWIADYDGDKTSVPPMGAWPVVAMKQWTDVDTVGGAPTKVDGDTFYGDFDAFAKYGYQASPAPSPAPAPVETPAPVPTPVSVPPAEPVPVTTPPADSVPTAPCPQPGPVPTAPPAATAPTGSASGSAGTPPATGQPGPGTKIDSLSKLPQPILVKIQEDEKVAVNWLGTTLGSLFLKLAGAGLGWLVAHTGVVQTNDVATSIVGMIVGSTISNSQNPAVPNTTTPKK